MINNKKNENIDKLNNEIKNIENEIRKQKNHMQDIKKIHKQTIDIINKTMKNMKINFSLFVFLIICICILFVII